MPSLSDIRAHIQSIQQTKKITNAMYLISSSRMNKTMKYIDQNRDYFYRALTIMEQIRSTTDLNHPYLVHRKGKNNNKTAYIVIASEKGLSGSYNHDILKYADNSMTKKNVEYIFTVGGYAASYFKRMGREVNENFVHIGQAPSINTARRLTHIIMDLYDHEKIDELRIVYTRFENALNQSPCEVEVLPIELNSLNIEQEKVNSNDDVLYEPSPKEVFNHMIPQFIVGYIYGALVHAYASENVSRMTAMERATKNADKMLSKLLHQYHMARQLAITNELSEIVGAANAIDYEQ